MTTRWLNVNGIYQIYPLSFKDANGDGIGDLRGILDQLDYIKGGSNSLGIDAIWLSPFYPSPMADFGYDVTDYCDIDPIFGTLEDFDQLLLAAHERNIKVMIDYVPNHTSDEHPWFLQSRSSHDNQKRDWYVWRDAKPDGSPPNNWLSVFGGSAWEWDEDTGQYYLHSFLAKQPDLNWANPNVRHAMADVLHFWLKRGVDGIRTDAVGWIAKDAEFRDNPRNPAFRPGDDPYQSQLQRYSRYDVRMFEYLREIAGVIEAYPDRIVLFEDYLDDNYDLPSQYETFYAVNPAVAAPFNFEGLRIPYRAENFRRFVDNFQAMVGNTLRPFYCFGNHDKPRIVSRVGYEQARLIAMMQMTLPGIPLIYYGDEIAMHDVEIPFNKLQDPFELQAPGLGLGRDPNRTPMQWSNEPHAGFSKQLPWLPLADDYASINVAAEAQDRFSMLTMYKSLLNLRRSNVLQYGEYKQWHSPHSDVFGYIRQYEGEAFLVLLNMSSAIIECRDDITGEVIYSTHASTELYIRDDLVLEPYQGLIIRRDP